uniref:Uncharacterized protein n=1 Tax=Phlebotomus papatasi TaxID=29031 RepID=A0A1B0DG60_PHLPP
MEFSVIQENSSYLQQLKTASTFLESASGNIENLKETIDERISGIAADKAREIEARERQLEEQLKRVERSRDLAEAERLKLLDLVQTLDVKLNKLSKEASEEQWMLKEKLATLEVERASFERERGKAKMSDLFGIGKPETAQITPNLPVKKPDPPAPVEPPKVKAEVRKETPKKTPELKSKVSFDDDTDLDLGFDPKQPKVKTNIFDDLLGTQPAKTQGFPQKSDPRPKTTPAPVSRQSTIDRDDGAAGLPVPTGRPRTGGRATGAIPDPLGLFSDTRENREKEAVKQEPQGKSAPVDWLGLGSDAPKDNQPKKALQEDSIPQNPEIQDSGKQILETMHHQEAQLVLASQMKSQERALVEIQARQADLLRRQEVQFSELMQKQMQRQSVLEENIRRQQEKINSHIEVLMNQPVVAGFPKESDEPRNQTDTLEVVELKADVKRLELEKLRLEDLLSNVKSNHEEELILMERSHKKQISVLEETLQSLENRLKSENTSLEEFYSRKIAKLEEEKK